jgi:hypothetical protein
MGNRDAPGFSAVAAVGNQLIRFILRHWALPGDCETSERIVGLTRLLVSEGTSSAQPAAAAEFAEAQLELLRIRAIRREMNEKIDLNRYDTQGLRKLAAIERPTPGGGRRLSSLMFVTGTSRTRRDS